jgi:streptomycin 6-kinase
LRNILSEKESTNKEVSAAGRSQGIAFRYGKGKVAVLGEAAMMTAQVTGSNKLKFGMNREGNDDKQLALNVMRW